VGYGSCGDQRTSILLDYGFTGEISELYVLRSAQRQGVGSGLMMAMARELLERGHLGGSLWVLSENWVARRFYESLGGRLVAQKRSGLAEVAYGWSDLQRLLSNSAG